MSKREFLRRLERELALLEAEERSEILGFYEERFHTSMTYENKTEEEVIADLERPEEIARNVLAEYGISAKRTASKEERYSNVSMAQVVLLLVFDLLLATWLIPTLFSVALSIFGSSFSWFATWSLMMGERTTVDEFVFAFLTAGYALFFLFGLVVLGAALFVTKTIVIWHLNVFKLRGREKWIRRMSRISVDGWFKRHRGWARIKNLVLVGSIVTIIYTGWWIFNHYDWVEAEYGSGKVQVDTITTDFSAELAAGDAWSIVTDFDASDVQIVVTDSDAITIIHKYYEDDDFTYEFDYENNVLTLSTELENRFIWDVTTIFQLFSENYSVRIEVPSDLLVDSVDISTDNGEVQLRNVDIDTIDIETSNGAVEVFNVNLVDNVTIRTTNGVITIKNVTVSGYGVVDVFSSHGAITIENTNFMEYDIETTNGRVDLTNLNVSGQDGVSLEVDTSNGPIDLENVYVDEINLETTNGDIDFFNDDTSFIPSEFERDTTNGDINTNVR
jgi:uncharacterized membrane protein